MRLSAEEIKAALLHPDQDVREAAVFYFSKSHSDDPSILPLVIDSVQRFGLNAFGTYSFLFDLNHTTDSVAWLIHQIEQLADGSNEHEEHVASAMRLALLRCQPALLQQHDAAIQSMRWLDEATKREISDRFAVGSITGEEVWAALHDFCETMDDDESFSSVNYDHARYLANALAPYREQYGEKICEYLCTPDDSIGWLEVFAAVAAGAMKLAAAVPSLVDALEDLDSYACQEAHSALEKIGENSVVQELTARYVQDVEIRLAAIAILENIHTDASVQACLGFLATEEDEFLRGFLLQAVLSNFDSAGIESARQHILRNEKSPEVLEVRAALLVACKLLNQTFPEFDAWKENSKHDIEFRRQWYQDHPLGQIDVGDSVDDSDFDDDFDDEGPDDYLDEFEDDEATEVEESQSTTIRRGERIGRNDPCPCGSGKKYKKCCYGKAKITEETDTSHASALGSLQASSVSRKYPIGTIALYGPNETVTTKIAASVIKHEDADPIVERWVGTNVLNNPKVQRQIKALFDKHRVKNVAQTDGNIGCPHEEGLDFQVGEDCPFCPHWAGKQGTARRE